MTDIFHMVTLIGKKTLSKDTMGFYFSTEEQDFTFLPGQYVTMRFEVDGKTETRDFSIASSPTKKGQMMIATKNGVSDFKKNLFALRIGDSVEITAPRGGFIFETPDVSSQVFIAGGLGITPFYSALTYRYDKNTTRGSYLFASFSTEEDVLFYEELKRIENEGMRVIYTISQPQGSWQGEKGRISQELLGKYLSDIHSHTYYIVGKVKMVDDMFDMLRLMGIPQDKIKIEYFTGY